MHAMIAAVVFLALIAWLDGSLDGGLPVFTPGGWLPVVFIGISRDVGYCMGLWALGCAAAMDVMVFLTLSPVTAAVLGTVILGEGLSPATVLGIGAVIAGLLVALQRT